MTKAKNNNNLTQFDHNQYHLTRFLSYDSMILERIMQGIPRGVPLIIQLIGYGLTGMGLTPLNIYFFIVGIFLWFITGYLWKDKAIMVVHVGALISILSGLFFSNS